MNKDKYKFATALIALVIAAMAFIGSLVCMIYYVKASGATQNIIMIPFLFICTFLTLATSIFSFINLNSGLGKIAFLLSMASIAFLTVSFILLF